MGTGGHRTAMPKWEAMEAEMSGRGIIPGTDGWPERSKDYYQGGTEHHPHHFSDERCWRRGSGIGPGKGPHERLSNVAVDKDSKTIHEATILCLLETFS